MAKGLLAHQSISSTAEGVSLAGALDLNESLFILFVSNSSGKTAISFRLFDER
jgi:hypothetical protein